MTMRVLGRKLAVIACGVLSAGGLVVTAASPAAAEPDGVNATAEFGVRFKDDANNGQCRVDDGSSGESVQWVGEGQWTLPLVLDTDNRAGGCGIWFGFNNQDGSLTGWNLNYLFETSPSGDTGQCPGVSGTQTVPILPILPIPAPFRWWMDPRITVDTDHRVGWCDLTLTSTGRSDVALDVLWEFNGDGGQCHGALPLGTNQYRTVQTGALPVTMGMDTDNRGGACFLSFRLRHLF